MIGKSDQQRLAQDDDNDRAKRRTGRDADQSGIGERIAKDTLQRDTRQSQTGTDRGAEHDPRRPDLAEYGLSRRIGFSDHRSEDLGEVEPDRAECEAGECKSYRDKGETEHTRPIAKGRSVDFRATDTLELHKAM